MTTGVAIALYNGARFLEEQLDTIRCQSCPPDRVVMCDDGSTDDTVAIARNYIEKHQLQERWSVSVNEQNLGYAKNFYRAMSLCGTDLIYMCDQDDVWKADKIERMNQVMADHPDISLLMCKGGVMDADGNAMHGLLISESKQTEAVLPVYSPEVLRSLSWTGMLMCVRKAFFDKWQEVLYPIQAPHDFALALCASDHKSFYTYDYVGAFHRRHDNNAANEEHRISKVLNLKTKLRDSVKYNGYLEGMVKGELPLSQQTLDMLADRFEKACTRESALRNGQLLKLIRLYAADRGRVLRLPSFLCDIWLVLFGDRSDL